MWRSISKPRPRKLCSIFISFIFWNVGTSQWGSWQPKLGLDLRYITGQSLLLRKLNKSLCNWYSFLDNFICMYFVSDCGITDPPEGEELTDSSGRGRESGGRHNIGKVSSQEKKKVCHLCSGNRFCSFFLYPSFPASSIPWCIIDA